MTSPAAEQIQWTALAPNAVPGAVGSSDAGLSSAEVAARLERHGPNRLPEAPPTSPWVVLLHQFQSPLIYILLAATVVTLLLQEWVDAGVIAAVLILNASIGFTQERRAEQSVRGLARLLTPKASVVRDGREQEIPSDQLVPGDLVLLESGDRVPADLRLVSVNALHVDESLLTGESLPIAKTVDPLPAESGLGDRTNMAYTGTVVTTGRGRGYVVGTGLDTELGRIATQVRNEVSLDTPLQQRLKRFATTIGIIVGVSCLVVFALGLFILGESPVEMFKVAVGLAVVAVPEGLPIVFTITLALGVRRMAARQAIIRRLPVVETLGSLTVIASDKTGTLTENRMTVESVWSAGERVRVTSDSLFPAPARDTLLAGVMTNEAHVTSVDGETETQGDPTEVAILVAGAAAGFDPEAVRRESPVLAEIPFESERRYSATVRKWDGRPVVFVKGATERLLEMSDSMAGPGGPVPLDPKAIREAEHAMAGDGLRVLAAARAIEPPFDAVDWQPSGLEFLGLIGMMDPPRQGVRDAVAATHSAGISVIMVTGDHAATARSIGAQLGIAPHDAPVVTGADLRASPDRLQSAIDEGVRIFARVEPTHKLEIVQELQRRGGVVAVTGDGINDAPALRAADVGVAMGRDGTDVAREAADVVLADDNYVTIVAAVEEGRITFDNLRKVTFFLISTGAAGIVAILATLAMGLPLIMLPAQLLWLNLVTNGLQDVALAFEPGEKGVLKRKPRPRNEGIVSRLLWERTAVAGLVMAAGTVWIFQYELAIGASLDVARTAALTTMVLFQIFHVGNARSDTQSVFRLNPFANPFLLLASAAAFLIHVAALYLPFTQFILRVEPLNMETWFLMVLVALTIVLVMELHKLVRNRWPVG